MWGRRRRASISAKVWILTGLVLVAAFLTFRAYSEEPGSPSAAEILAEVDSGALGEALLALPEAPEEAPPYSRDEFGQRWADTDRNGCDTRNDILARDLDQVTYREGTQECVVESGTLLDPYTGKTIDFVRGPDTSDAVQIDHVVALADAWAQGAYAWDLPTRELFANDPLNLLAVDGPANQQKGSAAADGWLPAEAGFHCEFAARQIAVKAKWSLGVSESERSALAEVLVGCALE